MKEFGQYNKNLVNHRQRAHNGLVDHQMTAASGSLAQTFAYSKVVHRRQSAYDVPTGTIKGLPLADRRHK